MLSTNELWDIFTGAKSPGMRQGEADDAGLRAVAEAAVKDAVGGEEIAKSENTKGFNQGVVYGAAIISTDCATFASELLSSAGITRAKAIELECDDHDISCIDENSAWPKIKES